MATSVAQRPQASLVFQFRNNVLCTACGGLGEPKEMVVWYVNRASKPWGPGKTNPEVHYIHNTERCQTKANTCAVVLAPAKKKSRRKKVN